MAMMFHEFKDAEQERLDQFRRWYARRARSSFDASLGTNPDFPLVMSEEEWYKRYITWVQTVLELEE